MSTPAGVVNAGQEAVDEQRQLTGPPSERRGRRAGRPRRRAAPGRRGARARTARGAPRRRRRRRPPRRAGRCRAAGRRAPSASRAPPPAPNAPPDMFSTTPATGIRASRAIRPTRAATDSAAELRGGDHDHRGVGQQLEHRQGHVAGAGRQVDQQHVELAPVDVVEELLEGLVQHRPAPHHRLVVGDEEARPTSAARRGPRPAASCPARRPAPARTPNSVRHASSPTRRRRARPTRCPVAPARRPGWRSPSTCRRRPCRRPTA